MNRPWHSSETRMLLTMRLLTPAVAHRKAVNIAKMRERKFEMNVANTYGATLLEHAILNMMFGFDGGVYAHAPIR